jgi:hypothetical protein
MRQRNAILEPLFSGATYTIALVKVGNERI